jgi:glycerol uptake facilitator-like aquaporin
MIPLQDARTAQEDRRADAAGGSSRIDLPRCLVAEALGTALLLTIVVGSGLMAEALAGGNLGVALLGNSLATGAGLVVLLTVFGPISGAHLNPAVSLVFAARGTLRASMAAAYLAAQVTGAAIGVWTAHLMFAEPLLQMSSRLRPGAAQVLSEGVATFGLVLAILASGQVRPAATPAVVGLYITSAYWFTASTSFANPAVTLARSMTDSFAGIAPSSVPGFILAQLAGAGMAAALFDWLFKRAPAE